MSSPRRKKLPSKKIEIQIFTKGIKTLFKLYDIDNSGFLEHDEFRGMLDDIREAMF